MGAKESEAMKRARELVLQYGYTAYKAAKATGMTRGAISKAQWYKDFKSKTNS